MGQHQHKIFSVKAKHSPNLSTMCLYVMGPGERRYEGPNVVLQFNRLPFHTLGDIVLNLHTQPAIAKE